METPVIEVPMEWRQIRRARCASMIEYAKRNGSPPIRCDNSVLFDPTETAAQFADTRNWFRQLMHGDYAMTGRYARMPICHHFIGVYFRFECPQDLIRFRLAFGGQIV